MNIYSFLRRPRPFVIALLTSIRLASAQTSNYGPPPVPGAPPPALPTYAVVDLGELLGGSSHATGINNSGQVVGYFSTNGAINFRAFLYSNGSIQDIGTLGGTDSEATGINDNGQVVGFSDTINEAYHAFLYSNGSMQNLGTLGGDTSQATALNNKGQVVGNSYTSGGAPSTPFCTQMARCRISITCRALMALVPPQSMIMAKW